MRMSGLIMLLKICVIFGAVVNGLASGPSELVRGPYDDWPWPSIDACSGIDPCFDPRCCREIPRLCLAHNHCRSNEECIRDGNGWEWNGYG